MRTKVAMILAGLVMVVTGAMAQDITMEEMEMLDKFRAEYGTKGVQLSPSDEARLLQRIRAFKGLAAAGPSGLAGLANLAQPQMRAPQQSPGAPAIAPISDADARKQLDLLPAGAQLASFQLMRDGIKFNGQRYADPEGKAEQFAVDPETSTVAYVVSMGTFSNVKVARLGSGSEPVTVGRLTASGNRQSFQSSTGKTLSGDLFFPLTDGALLVRDSVGFRYVVGEGVKQIDFPAGWSPAPLQRGNTSNTGWLLLERDTVEDKGNPLGVLKLIGEIAGALPARMDYALFNLSDKRLVPFDISTDGKSVATFAQCKRKNTFVNRCDQMRTYDSIWRPDGSANFTHYFWLIDWQKSQGKSIAVVLEKSLQQVNGYDLSGTKRVNLFERMMGINNYHMALGNEGKYRMTARLGFDTGTMEDVALEIQNRQELPRKQ